MINVVSKAQPLSSVKFKMYCPESKLFRLNTPGSTNVVFELVQDGTNNPVPPEETTEIVPSKLSAQLTLVEV